MSSNSGYKKQKNLSLVQFLAELPTFIESLVSAILSKTLFLYVDLLDSFGYIVRYAMVMLLSKKLSEDLRYEYNYGIGKIEAVASLLCDGLVLFGMILTLGFSVYSIIFPDKPSDLLIIVAGLKLYDVVWDVAFFVKQRKIRQNNNSALIETNYAATVGALVFDLIALASLLIMWLFRNDTVGGYISPIISILAVVYLGIGCIKRIKDALDELTDKTLPEKLQMKILSILTKYYDSYSQFHSINSHKSGELMIIDIHLSFENNATFEEIQTLKKQIQDDFDTQIGNCTVNIVVGEG